MNNTIKIDGIEYNLVPVEKKEEVKQEYKPGDWVYYTKMQEVRKVIDNTTYVNIASKELYDMYGSWMSMGAVGQHYTSVRYATKEEIQTHLIALAKKKGYDTAKKVKSVLTETIYSFNFVSLRYSETSKGLSDSIVTIYKDGEWAEIVKEEEKKFTFGGQEVIMTKTNVVCKGVMGTFKQIENIINNPFIINQFGNTYTISLMTSNNITHFTLTDNSINRYKNLITSIKIGCLTGNYNELLDIYNHMVELNKK